MLHNDDNFAYNFSFGRFLHIIFVLDIFWMITPCDTCQIPLGGQLAEVQSINRHVGSTIQRAHRHAPPLLLVVVEG